MTFPDALKLFDMLSDRVKLSVLQQFATNVRHDDNWLPSGPGVAGWTEREFTDAVSFFCSVRYPPSATPVLEADILALLAIKPYKVEELAHALGFENTRPVRMALARLLDAKQVMAMGDRWIPKDMQSFYEDR
jgi:hypothetical protein